MESTSYVFSFRMVFFYLVTTGWIFDISLRENSTNQSIGNLWHQDDVFGYELQFLSAVGISI